VPSTLEVAYAKAHEDAAGAGAHAGYAAEMFALTRLLAELLPHDPEALALAALVRYAEARRPARLDEHAVALAEVEGVEPALCEVESLNADALRDLLPFHVVRADLLRRAGRHAEGRAAYAAALALGPAPAERMWLERRQQLAG
jgi:predicted RNA polymerase sigma factor